MCKNLLGRLILANYVKLFFYLFLTLPLIGKVYSWNAVGHRLVGQIAYNHLTKQVKRVSNHYNHALDKVYRPQSFVNSAVWLDSLRYQKKSWLQEIHYIDLPFSLDGTALVPPQKINAITALEEAQAILQSKEASDFAKGFNLRLLIHVVGDLHQPLHAVSQMSKAHPTGDKGGNLVWLNKNSVATNLHAYWDRGGGFLIKSPPFSKKQLLKTARKIEQRWPCNLANMNLDPKQWASESQQIAIHEAYQLKKGHKLDKHYQNKVKEISEKRIALAGCRLAALLNASLSKPVVF